jgi:hypothetical protein
VFYLRQISTRNNIIPKYMTIFIYPPSVLCFAFMYLYCESRYFTDEFSVKFYGYNRHPKGFSFGIFKVFIQSNQT